MKTAKQELIELVERMPDDAPMDALLAEMHFKASVLRGLEQARRGEGMSHDEIRDRLGKWLESSGREELSGT